MISGYPHFWKNSFDSFTWRIWCIPPCLLSDVSKKCWSEDPGAHQMISGCSFGPVGSECNRSMNSSVFSMVMLGITGKHEWKRYFLLLKIFLKQIRFIQSFLTQFRFISRLPSTSVDDFQVTGPTTPIPRPGAPWQWSSGTKLEQLNDWLKIIDGSLGKQQNLGPIQSFWK